MAPSPPRRARAFTLVELLVVLAIIAVVVALVATAAGRVRASAMRARCITSMRSVGTFVSNHATTHEGRLPRSQHSAVANGEPPWILEFYASEFGAPIPPSSDPRWNEFVRARLRCPFDERDRDASKQRYSSYGLNVYFELSPAETGGPVYRTLSRVRLPGRTVLAGELDEGSLADHLMAHFWTQYGTPPEVAPDRHGATQGVLFADGHVADVPFAQTFQDNGSLDLWNPATAR
ncbi:MAG: prepilin-type N-terminal cleavage/methylation domain-containing protein [Phycisphaerae bacterium]|jgi:prepilin-type N-terminal cleavage/methylation domain-containing protein/prepilin-type processing-associated H-X9-DG protein|nr:prepilin-type N-terminal cleavage/methylation domain-containing protein [Phycisphaerae bacterium]